MRVMKRTWIALAIAGTCSCGSDDGEERPTSCDPVKDRVGTYLFTAKERAGGDCGPVDDTLVRFEESGVVGGGSGDCVLLAPPAISDGGCTLEQSVECILPSGLVSTTTTITTQTTADGSRLEGSIDLRGTDGSGRLICHSLYDVTYSRQ